MITSPAIEAAGLLARDTYARERERHPALSVEERHRRFVASLFRERSRAQERARGSTPLARALDRLAEEAGR